MKTLSTILLKIILLLALSLLLPGHPFASDVEYVPGEILVKFKDGTPSRDVANLHAVLNAKKKKEFPGMKLHHLKISRQISVEEAIRKYEQDPNVEYAEPNYILHAHATIPNDPLFAALWGLYNNNDFDIDMLPRPET